MPRFKHQRHTPVRRLNNLNKLNKLNKQNTKQTQQLKLLPQPIAKSEYTQGTLILPGEILKASVFRHRRYSRNANLLWGAWLVASFFGTCSKQGPEPFTPLRRNQFRKNHGFRHRASHDLPKDTGWRSFLYCVLQLKHVTLDTPPR